MVQNHSTRNTFTGNAHISTQVCSNPDIAVPRHSHLSFIDTPKSYTSQASVLNL